MSEVESIRVVAIALGLMVGVLFPLCVALFFRLSACESDLAFSRKMNQKACDRADRAIESRNRNIEALAIPDGVKQLVREAMA